MSKNKEIGNKGESIAAKYLNRLGYRIITTNYRFEKTEIDIIAREEDVLIFIEVKTRKSLNYGLPEDAVDNKKIENILDCANYYINITHWTGPIRFDIISIMLFPEISINHLKDAFY